MKLYDWQEHDQKVLAANNWTGLLNIEPGGGKTVAAAAAIKASGAATTLIIAPDQTHKSTWIKTVEEVADITPRIIGNQRKATKDALWDFEMGYEGVYLATPQFFTRSGITENWNGDMVVVDEGHLLNSAKTKGQIALSGFNPKQAKESLAARFDSRLFLSGTAWRNSFERAWATMRFLWPDQYRRGEVAYDNYFMWLADRMTYEDIVKGVKWQPATEDQYRNPPEGYWRKRGPQGPLIGRPDIVKKWLNEAEPGKLLSEAPCVIIHKRREECCQWHPNGFLPTDAPQEIRQVVTLAPAQKRAIKELEDHYFTYLEDQPLEVQLSLTQKQRIRQICLGVPHIELTEEGQAKVRFDVDCVSPFMDEVFEILDSLDGEPVVIFVQSQQFAEVATAKLNKAGISAFEFSGATKKVRDQNVAEFGTKYQVAVISIDAGGTGLDGLQKVTKTEIWLERSVDETNNIQAEARADRMGGIGQVQRYIILDDGGRAEGRMSEQLEKRERLASTLRVR